MKISRVGCFGKIPTQGDFVRHHAEPFAYAGLDRWLQEGLATLARTGVALSPSRFLFLAGDAMLGGVLVPSRDRVGRQFPLAVFVVVAGAGDAARLSPILLGDFMTAAEAVADVAVRGMELTALRQHVDSLRGVVAEETAKATLGEYCDATPLRAFAADVLGHDDLPVIEDWFTNVAASVGNAEPPHYVVRSVVVDEAIWLAAWLSLVGTASRHRIQLALWERVGAAGISSCRVIFDPLQARYAAPMLNPQATGDLVFDVTPQASVATRPGPANDWARALVGDGCGSVATSLGRMQAP